MSFNFEWKDKKGAFIVLFSYFLLCIDSTCRKSDVLCQSKCILLEEVTISVFATVIGSPALLTPTACLFGKSPYFKRRPMRHFLPPKHDCACNLFPVLTSYIQEWIAKFSHATKKQKNDDFFKIFECEAVQGVCCTCHSLELIKQKEKMEDNDILLQSICVCVVWKSWTCGVQIHKDCSHFQTKNNKNNKIRRCFVFWQCQLFALGSDFSFLKKSPCF